MGEVEFNDGPSDGQLGGVSSIEWVRPDAVVVALHGELDMATVPAAIACFEQIIAEHPAHLVLDLIDVTFFGSAAVGMLIAADEDLQLPAQLHLIGVADNVKVDRILELSGVRLLFRDHDDVAAVLQSIDEKA